MLNEHELPLIEQRCRDNAKLSSKKNSGLSWMKRAVCTNLIGPKTGLEAKITTAF